LRTKAGVMDGNLKKISLKKRKKASQAIGNRHAIEKLLSILGCHTQGFDFKPKFIKQGL